MIGHEHIKTFAAKVFMKKGYLTNPPRLTLSDGSLEALKWIGLVLMTGDHANKFLLKGSQVHLFEAGRVALPLFAFVLAYNLARPSALSRGSYRRTIKKLAIFGLISMPACAVLGGLAAGWWPLNILFTLLVAAFTMSLLDRGNKTTAILCFLLGGFLVEYLWFGIALCIPVWCYCKRPGWVSLLLILLSYAALTVINGNLWAFAALPMILLASSFNKPMPRLRWFFYFYYPAHLWVLSSLMIIG